MATKATSDASFEVDVINSKGPVLVDFWAEWCGPCRALGPKLEELSDEMADVAITKLNVDENPETASKYGVRSIPTMMLFKGGEVVEHLVGNVPKEDIQAAITKHLN